MHDLQRWSKDEMSVKRRSQMPTDIQGTSKTPTQQTPGAQSKGAIGLSKDKLNIRYKELQAQTDKNTKKR